MIAHYKLKVKVVNKFTLNGTIDPHDPIGVTFRVEKPDGDVFRVTFISANLGRGYASTRVFKNNVLRILNKVGEREYVIIGFQEIDEADSAHEKVILAHMMEPGTQLVRWETREPIAVSPGVKVARKRKMMTMDQGTRIGAPAGTGPERFFVSCLVDIEGVVFGVGNQHPHRNLAHGKVQDALERGDNVTENEIASLIQMSDVVVDMGDFNKLRPKKAHPAQRTAHKRRLDHIRWIKVTKKMREAA